MLFPTRRTSLAAAGFFVILALLLLLPLHSFDYRVRLGMILRGKPSARLIPATARSGFVTHSVSVYIITEGSSYLGYVRPSGSVILATDSHGDNLNVTDFLDGGLYIAEYLLIVCVIFSTALAFRTKLSGNPMASAPDLGKRSRDDIENGLKGDGLKGT